MLGLALSPHTKKVLGSIPGVERGPFFVESMSFKTKSKAQHILLYF